MTTIVIHNGNVFTDTKSTIIDKNAGESIRQHILDNIHTTDEDTLFGIESFINSKYVDDNYNISFERGKFISLTEEDLIIPGEKVKGMTFAGFANLPIYAGYYLKGNKRTLDEFINKFTHIDKVQQERSTEHYKDNEEFCNTLAGYTYGVIAVVTDKGTHLVMRKDILNPNSGFISIFYPKETTVVIGSGVSALYGLDAHIDLILNSEYDKHYTTDEIKSTSDAVDFIKRASLVDIMTNDDVRVF